jgi:hypothetical protein
MEDCIPSPKGSRTKAGYRAIYVEPHRADGIPRRRDLAHRLAWAEANGPIPEGMVVRHTCDNPPCVNPAHLILGTQKDNVGDMDRRGRRGYGMAKVTADHVRAIRASAEDYRVLMARYGISKSTLNRIRRRESWAHIQ